MTQSPLNNPEPFLDAIAFLKNNFVCHADEIYVPYAADCTFVAPLFSKFKFNLNFSEDESYYFWQIFKENRFLLMESLSSFDHFSGSRDTKEYRKIMFDEQRPIFKALMFLILSDADYKQNFNKSLSLDLKDVFINKEEPSVIPDFVFQSCLGLSITDKEKIDYLNNFHSKILIIGNENLIEFFRYDHKIDFDKCSILITTV